jgi:tetratricopeptide (TPR) repeat protein
MITMTFGKFPSVVAISLVIAGCGKVEMPADADGSGVTAPAATRSTPRALPAVMISDDEAKQFAAALEQALANDDEPAFHGLIDWKAMANEATTGFGLPAAAQASLANGLVTGVTQPGVFVNALKQGGTARYQLTRLEEIDGRKYAWFRLINDSGVNFHRFRLTKTGDMIHSDELYVMLSGEPMSETWRRLMLPVATEQNKNWLQKLATQESDFVANIDKFQQLSQQCRSQDYAGALATYNSMPDSMKKDRLIMILRYQAAMGSGESEIIAAADDFRAAHPDAKAIDMMMIDAHVLRKEFAEAIACLDRVQQEVGADSYLESLAASMYLEQQDEPQAIARLKKAIKLAPVASEAYWTLLPLALAQHDSATVAEVLTELHDLDELNIEGLKELPNYPEFAESPEGKAWLEEHN